MWLSIFSLGVCIASLLLWRRSRLRAVENSCLYEELVRKLQAEKMEALGEATMHQAVFNSMVEGCLLLDSNQKILSANRTLLTLFNLEKQPQGQQLLEAIRHYQLQDLVKAANATGKVQDYELQILRGRPLTLQVNAAAVFGPLRRRMGTVLVFHDITRIKELETVRKDFVANVSHELRTPVTLVRSAIETLLDGAKDDPEASARFLQTIARQSGRLTLLLDDLLVISELESGRSRLELAVAPIHPLVATVIDQLSAAAQEKGLSITSSVNAEEMGYFDSARLEQVLINLLDNAVKYTASGGAIHIGAARESGQSIKVFVQDNGPGIPREDCERIFERFYRVDKSRARHKGGTGLGLSIVKHIIQAHGGKVWVESALGEGAKFCFTLAAPLPGVTLQIPPAQFSAALVESSEL